MVLSFHELSAAYSWRNLGDRASRGVKDDLWVAWHCLRINLNAAHGTDVLDLHHRGVQLNIAAATTSAVSAFVKMRAHLASTVYTPHSINYLHARLHSQQREVACMHAAGICTVGGNCSGLQGLQCVHTRSM